VNIDAIDFHQEITLDLEPASSMEGRLLDLAGRPLLSGKKKAIVTAVPVAPANAPSPSVLTGIEGWFRLTGLTAGTYDIYIETQHKEDAYPPRTRITQIEVAPGRDVLARDLVYGHADKELTIAGLVTTKDGRPVGDARVNAEGSVRRETVTDANGRFILRGLDPNRYQVIARSSLGGVGMATDVEAGRHDLTIRLGGMGKIEGRVIDGASGNPVSEFEVSVGDKPYFEPGQTVEGQTTLWVRDDRGRFQVKYIPMGSAVLAVRAPGYAPTTRTINPVADNNDAADVVVRLDRGGEIRGRALEGDKPLVGQRVWIQAGNFGFSTRTNSRGYYALANLPPGPCFLNFSIHKPGDVRRSILRRATVVTGKSVTVDLSVRSADAALAGLVTFDGALPSRAHLHVSVETPGGETEQFYADVNPDGTYYLETVPVGLATVQAVAASPEGDQRSQTATMKTVSGAVMRQDFNFTEALNVSGRVHGLRPNEYAVLVASKASGRSRPSLRPTRSGICSPTTSPTWCAIPMARTSCLWANPGRTRSPPWPRPGSRTSPMRPLAASSPPSPWRPIRRPEWTLPCRSRPFTGKARRAAAGMVPAAEDEPARLAPDDGSFRASNGGAVTGRWTPVSRPPVAGTIYKTGAFPSFRRQWLKQPLPPNFLQSRVWVSGLSGPIPLCE
jgi:hypothetical protein